MKRSSRTQPDASPDPITQMEHEVAKIEAHDRRMLATLRKENRQFIARLQALLDSLPTPTFTEEELAVLARETNRPNKQEG